MRDRASETVNRASPGTRANEMPGKSPIDFHPLKSRRGMAWFYGGRLSDAKSSDH